MNGIESGRELVGLWAIRALVEVQREAMRREETK
jgi:hypothetical protein